MLRTRNNTDGNKLVIFSGIALYYGDTYIVLLLTDIDNNLLETYLLDHLYHHLSLALVFARVGIINCCGEMLVSGAWLAVEGGLESGCSVLEYSQLSNVHFLFSTSHILEFVDAFTKRSIDHKP